MFVSLSRKVLFGGETYEILLSFVYEIGDEENRASLIIIGN